MSIMKSKPPAQTNTPKSLLTIFMSTALIVVILVILNLIQPAIIEGPIGSVINVIFWVTLILTCISLLGLIWYFLWRVAQKGLSVLERLMLGIMIPSSIIVILMVLFALVYPANFLAEKNVAVNQLFWSMVSIMLLSLILFLTVQVSTRAQKRKKKSKMYYY